MIALTTDQAYRKALECYQAGRIDKAEEICRKVLDADPTHCDTAYLLAAIAHRGGRSGEGDALLRQAVEARAHWIRLGYRPPDSPRHGAAPHRRLAALLEPGLDRYLDTLRSFEGLKPQLDAIPAEAAGPDSPFWNNMWVPPLDGLALYAMTALRRPRQVIEVGSGNSTKFIRRAIRDHGLQTTVVSIDPQPRAEIDTLCDQVVRAPLESCDLALFDALDSGDMVFVDNSHRCFMNSDVTVFFTEILPALPQDVTVGIHDIYLPYDYPAEWVDRYFSEQYLLACYLLSGSPPFDVVLPLNLLTRHERARDAVAAWHAALPESTLQGGTSFWLRTGRGRAA